MKTGTVEWPDFFLATADEPPLRDNRDVMEYPFLSLQKRRVQPIVYRDGKVGIRVGGDVGYGLATIWDWDVIIGLCAQVNDAIERSLPVSPRIQFVPYNLLTSISRSTGGKDYKELTRAIRRLALTNVETTIRTGDQGERMGFHWLATYRIPVKYRHETVLSPEDADHDGEPDPARPWEVELPSWLHNAILSRSGILAVHPDYFGLTGGIERWLYRLARKAVPDKAEVKAINFRMETLHRRSGVTRELKKFAHDVRQIAERQPLPEYGITVTRLHDHETVTFWRDPKKPRRPRRGFARTPEELPAD